MENTYTYTARSAVNAEEVITFTLYNNSLSIGLGVPLEHVERAIAAGADEGEEPESAGEEPKEKTDAKEKKAPVKSWLKPMAISAIERTTHPFNVNDVSASATGGGLSVIAWVRSGGLRLAPVVFKLSPVDNPDAAKSFVEELERRKKAAPSKATFPGPLDYWASWVAAGFTALIFLVVWLRKQYKQRASA